jgi:hypothetical protein
MDNAGENKKFMEVARSNKWNTKAEMEWSALHNVHPSKTIWWKSTLPPLEGMEGQCEMLQTCPTTFK